MGGRRRRMRGMRGSKWGECDGGRFVKVSLKWAWTVCCEKQLRRFILCTRL